MIGQQPVVNTFKNAVIQKKEPQADFALLANYVASCERGCARNTGERFDVGLFVRHTRT